MSQSDMHNVITHTTIPYTQIRALNVYFSSFHHQFPNIIAYLVIFADKFYQRT